MLSLSQARGLYTPKTYWELSLRNSRVQHTHTVPTDECSLSVSSKVGSGVLFPEAVPDKDDIFWHCSQTRVLSVPLDWIEFFGNERYYKLAVKYRTSVWYPSIETVFSFWSLGELVVVRAIFTIGTQKHTPNAGGNDSRVGCLIVWLWKTLTG